MAISGDLRVSATLACCSARPQRGSFASISKLGFNCSFTGGSRMCEIIPKLQRTENEGHSIRCQRQQPFSTTGDYKLPYKPVNQEVESFLHSAINMSFFERLGMAWKVLFPPPATRRSSNANIAKQRLKMILFSDRCAVSEEAKQKIVQNIVGALSDFVIIDSEDKVQLSVSTDPDLGTIYSVSVPIRRVKTQYQEKDETGLITNIEYKDAGESSGASVDVRFDFFVPDD